MRHLFKVACAVALVIGSAGSIHAAAPAWEIDKAHSRFGFEIKHIFSSVYGHFEKYSGEILFDPDQPQQSSMSFTIEADSIQTFIGKRDNHLRSADFFEVKKYPLITFVSSSISKVDDERYEVAGRLTIKDVTEEITLPFVMLGMIESPLEPGKMIAGLETRLPLDRLQYHVGDGTFLRQGVLGREVQVIVSLEVMRAK